MKRNFLPIAVVISLLVLFDLSWSQCPQDPVDLGICDTLYVETFDSDHVYDATGAYDSVRVAIYVTHDSNTFWWGDASKFVQDSITGFVIPLKWSKAGCADSVLFPITGSPAWNNKNSMRGTALFKRSIFRDLVDVHTGDTVYNRYADMQNDPLYWDPWTVNINFTGGNAFLSMLAPGFGKWWEGQKILLATLTFLVYQGVGCDSTAICLDSTFWPPSSNLALTRYDAVNYVPRHFLPVCNWITLPLIVSSPNGGEVWGIGETHDITWISPDFTGTDVKIEFSTDGGTSWTTIIASTPNDGTHPWVIPNTPSTLCRVRVSDAVDGVPSDISDANFTISAAASLTVTSPDGGESWEVGSAHDITWNWSGSFTDVKIELSRDGGSAWETLIVSTPNDGSWNWASVTGSPSTTCKVRISDAADGDPTDMSNANFTIYQPSITVTSPNGGESWEVGSAHDITWNWAGLFTDVKIELSRDGGSTWETLIVSTPNDGSWNWTSVTGPPSTTCKVRISDAADGDPTDMSDNNFTITSPASITVTSPNGGEHWCVDSTYNITWSSSGIDSVEVMYIIPLGDTTPIAKVAAALGTYAWTVPNNPSTDSRVIICDASDFNPCDQSDSFFTIEACGNPPDFAIGVTPDTLKVPRGYSGDYKVILTSINGFASSCTLTVMGHPDGSSATFDQPVLIPTDSSVLTIFIPDTTTLNTFTLTITATEMVKGIVHSQDVVLVVTLPTWSFRVETFPDTQLIHPGDTATYGVTIVPNLGFQAPCTLYVEGLPSGATGNFDPNPILPNDSSVLTITTTPALLATPPGEYDLTIIGVASFKQKDTTYVKLIIEEETGVNDENEQLVVPDKFTLFQNQPNPFNPETQISYYLSEGCQLELAIYNVLGRKVRILLDGYQTSGMKTVVWDGKDDQGSQLGSGIYFYRLQAGTFSQTRKMSLIK